MSLELVGRVIWSSSNNVIMPPKLRNQIDSESLTMAWIRALWENEFLPSIRNEIKAEIAI